MRYGVASVAPILFRGNMSKRLLDRNPITGEETWHHYDHATGKTTIETVQDCKSIIEQNKKEQSMGWNHTGQDWMKFARIPNSVLLKFKNELNLDYMDNDDLKKIVNMIEKDPEYKYLRTY